MYLKYRNLTTVGKYFLLRIDATPSSANHLLHIRALDRVVELLKLHIMNISVCNPLIVRFLYNSSKVLQDNSIELLLIQQLSNYPNQTNWYRAGIPNWFNNFFFPEDNELLRKIIINEISEYSRKNFDNDWLDILESGNSGLIAWMKLLSDYLPKEKCGKIKDKAVKRIVSNINQYKVLTDMSLNHGCSGIGLALLSCIDNKCNKWINLL